MYEVPLLMLASALVGAWLYHRGVSKKSPLPTVAEVRAAVAAEPEEKFERPLNYPVVKP